MAQRTTEATGRAVAGQRWQTQRDVASESVAEGFSVQQELEAEAQAIASSRAGVQAVEACSTGTLSAIQTGTACEDRDAEAERRVIPTTSPNYIRLLRIRVILVRLQNATQLLELLLVLFR